MLSRASTSIFQPTPQSSQKSPSDLQGSWGLQDPQGPLPHMLGPKPLRRVKPWAGHGNTEQRAGPVEEQVGSGQMPRGLRGAMYPRILTCLHPLQPARTAVRQHLSQTPPLHRHLPPPWRKERLGSAPKHLGYVQPPRTSSQGAHGDPKSLLESSPRFESQSTP